MTVLVEKGSLAGTSAPTVTRLVFARTMEVADYYQIAVVVVVGYY